MYVKTYRPSPSLAILLIALIGFVAQAQSLYPKAEETYVNDFARLLSARDKVAIRTQLSKLRSDAGVHAVVVTIRSIHNYKTDDQTIESFATNLFNTWGIGDSVRNDGILILVAVKDRKTRIELGSGFGDSYNSQMQSVISNQMIPHFRKKQFGLGIIDGTNAVVQIFSERAPTLAPTPAQLQGARDNLVRSTTESSATIPFSVIGGGVIAAMFGLMLYTLSRIRRCANCRVRMIRVDGEEKYLDDGQKLENSLGSVDYQVWQCPKCGDHELEAKNRRFSPFRDCRECGYRTLEADELITIHPTHLGPGEKQIDENCRSCGFHNQLMVIIPALPSPTEHIRSGFDYSQSSFDSSYSDSSSSSYDSGSSSSFDSSSSSSSSYDGGSSSGDGASGSW